ILSAGVSNYATGSIYLKFTLTRIKRPHNVILLQKATTTLKNADFAESLIVERKEHARIS
ncbi:hypothetical protein, partial [Escherichia coli]|uniref:hypothetical protein n=1 Tax=Escherichia coli TaxID=562 RepID=UPI0038B409C7